MNENDNKVIISIEEYNELLTMKKFVLDETKQHCLL